MDAATDTSPPLTDPDDAMRRAGDRRDVAAQLFRLLHDSIDDTATRLRDAIRAGNIDALRDTAHRFHGACLYCGVPRLRMAVAEVERLCRVGGRVPRHPELEEAVRRLLDTMEATRAAGDPLAGRTQD